MIFLKIVLTIVAVIALLFIWDFYSDNLAIPTFIGCIVSDISLLFFVISLWGKFTNILIISVGVFVISFIFVIIIKILLANEEKKSYLTMQNVKELSDEELRNAYYFLSKPLELVRINSQSLNLKKRGKAKVVTKNEIVHINTTTKGKFLEIKGNEIRIQFDATEDCSLVFKYIPGYCHEEDVDRYGFFELPTHEKDGSSGEDHIAVYNKKEYNCYSDKGNPIILKFQLVKNNKVKTKKQTAKGAW